MGVSLAAGLLLDALAADTVRSAVRAAPGRSGPWLLALLQLFSAIGLVALLAASFVRTRFVEGRAQLRQQLAGLAAALRRASWRSLARPPVLTAGLLLAVLVLLPKAALVVGPGQRGVVQRFGRVVASDLSPGLHWHLPDPLGRGLAVDTENVRQIDVGFLLDASGARLPDPRESFFVTADENLVDLRSTVHYRVSDAARYALAADSPEALVRSAARRELVSFASRTPIDAVYSTERAEFESGVTEAVRRRVAALGIGCEVLAVRLLDVHAPAPVHDAFRDVASALEDRQRSVHDASGYAAERAAAAGGEAAALLEAARADATRARLAAGAAVTAFASLAAVRDAAPALTERRLYLETLERALPKVRKLVNGEPGGDVDLWLGRGAVPLPSPPVVPPPPRRPTLEEQP